MAEGEEKQSSGSGESVKIFVGQVPKHMTEAELLDMFEEFALVDEVNIIKDMATKAPRGCCFLICPSRHEADKAVNACHNKQTLPWLSLSASKLRDMDVFSKSDPMAVVYTKRRDGTLEEIGRAEVINALDPVWVGKVSINYQFEIVQPLIVVKHNKSLTLNLRGMSGHRSVKNKGTITVHAEETVASRKAIEMIFRCSHLENRDLFSKSDPFLRISKIVESGGSIPICKTEVAMNNLNPTWKPVCLTMQQFGSEKSVAELEILHKEKIGANFQIPSSFWKDHMKMLKSQLFVDGFLEKMQYSFLDYISSGFELSFMVAVDFTASNGNPLLPQSLHYIDPSGQLNSYQQVIFEVGEVVQFYDSDKHFPAWGLGGRTMDSAVSHCFSLNGSASDPEVEGVNGIMAARSSALRNVALAGPTLFGQVINKAAQIASQLISYNQSKYFILLILTDGVLSDLQETVNVLVKASDLALSILIIGVGGADFKEMEFLDADNRKRLESSTGRIGTRDILQFVPMREVHGGQISIVQSLLEELPSQFLTYMRSSDVNPHFVNEAQTSATENLPKSF